MSPTADSRVLPVSASSTPEEVSHWLYGIGREAIKPGVALTVSEWADQYRILAKGGSAEPGPWRTDRTPYLRDIMDALSVDSPYEYVIFMAGAQLGKTEAGLNWLGYIIHLSPAGTMVVWPTLDDIKSNVSVRIKPFFDSTPCVGERIGEGSGPRDGGNNTYMKVFPGGFLNFAASNSSAKLRSKPIRFLFTDEIDEYPTNANQQGDPFGLAEARTQSYGSRKKVFVSSTPTLENASRIEELYQTTDMRRFYVPCPFCGTYQVFTWDQMRSEPGRADAVWQECIHCAGRIENFHKVSMLARGEWRPERESDDPKWIGFHLPGLYSPVGMLSWSECMSKYLAAAGDLRKLQVWTNTVLGESFAQKGERPEWERLYNRCGEYELGTVPEGVLLITAGVDVQKDRIEAEVVGWGRGKESWSLGYYVFPGITDDLDNESWNGLRDLLSTGFAHPTAGVVMNIRCAAIDSGYETMTVYNFARDYATPKVVVTKGLDSLAAAVGIPRAVDVKLPNGKVAKRGVKYWPVGVSVLKHELYSWLRLGKGDIVPPGYVHFPAYGEEYFKQLTAEEWVERESRLTKKRSGEWKKTRERNEVLDCRIYARAAAAILRIDMFKNPEWDRLELSLGVTRAAPPDASNQAAPAGPVARPEKRRYRSKGIQ